MQEEYKTDRLPDYEEEPEFGEEEWLPDDLLEASQPYQIGKNHRNGRISEEIEENDGS